MTAATKINLFTKFKNKFAFNPVIICLTLGYTMITSVVWSMTIMSGVGADFEKYRHVHFLIMLGGCAMFMHAFRLFMDASASAKVTFIGYLIFIFIILTPELIVYLLTM